MALALSYKPGDWLQPADIFSDSLQKVTGVYTYPESPDVVEIFTLEDFHSFRVNEQVVFPRREGGKTVIWEEGEPIDLSKVAIGDIIPPELGYRDENYAGALRVGNIIRTKQFGGWFVDLSPIHQSADKPGRYLVPWTSYTDFWQSAVLLKPAPTRTQPVIDRTTSGWYQDAFGNHVRFRLVTVRGRRPVGCVDLPATQAQWEQYALMDGEKPHPADPRYSTAE